MKVVKIPVEVLLATKQQKTKRIPTYMRVINLVIGDQAMEFVDHKKAMKVYNAAHAYVKRMNITDYAISVRQRDGKTYVFKRPLTKDPK